MAGSRKDGNKFHLQVSLTLEDETDMLYQNGCMKLQIALGKILQELNLKFVSDSHFSVKKITV